MMGIAVMAAAAKAAAMANTAVNGVLTRSTT